MKITLMVLCGVWLAVGYYYGPIKKKYDQANFYLLVAIFIAIAVTNL